MFSTIIPKKPSKKVESFDQIKEDAITMQIALERGDYTRVGIKKIATAIHHSQVNPEPFNFFVIRRDVVGASNNEVIVVANPKILTKDKTSKRLSLEGCLSFPFRPDKTVNRYSIITVGYESPDKDGNLVYKEETLTGVMAAVFQHECEHAHGKNIYTN